MQNSVLWGEDLESHRQPSLYYLSSDEGEDGPYLICDWNGAPADFSEMELETLAVFNKQEEIKEVRIPDKDKDGEETQDDEYVDYPNPAADIIKTAHTGEVTTPTCRQNDMDFKECAHLDFLSVPPMLPGLLKRAIQNVLHSRKTRPKTEKEA